MGINLGGISAGFTESLAADRREKFELLLKKQQFAAEQYAKLAADATIHPSARNELLQHAIQTAGTDTHKFKIDKLPNPISVLEKYSSPEMEKKFVDMPPVVSHGSSQLGAMLSQAPGVVGGGAGNAVGAGGENYAAFGQAPQVPQSMQQPPQAMQSAFSNTGAPTILTGRQEADVPVAPEDREYIAGRRNPMFDAKLKAQMMAANGMVNIGGFADGFFPEGVPQQFHKSLVSAINSKVTRTSVSEENAKNREQKLQIVNLMLEDKKLDRSTRVMLHRERNTLEMQRHYERLGIQQQYLDMRADLAGRVPTKIAGKIDDTKDVIASLQVLNGYMQQYPEEIASATGPLAGTSGVIAVGTAFNAYSPIQNDFLTIMSKLKAAEGHALYGAAFTAPEQKMLEKVVAGPRQHPGQMQSRISAAYAFSLNRLYNYINSGALSGAQVSAAMEGLQRSGISMEQLQRFSGQDIYDSFVKLAGGQEALVNPPARVRVPTQGLQQPPKPGTIWKPGTKETPGMLRQFDDGVWGEWDGEGWAEVDQ